MDLAEIWLQRLVGVLMATALIATLLGLFAHRVQDENQFIDIVVRLADNLRPQLLFLSLLVAAILFFAGARIFSQLLAITSLFGLLWIAADHTRNKTLCIIVNKANQTFRMELKPETTFV